MSAGNEETIVVVHHPQHPSVVTLRPGGAALSARRDLPTGKIPEQEMP